MAKRKGLTITAADANKLKKRNAPGYKTGRWPSAKHRPTNEPWTGELQGPHYQDPRPGQAKRMMRTIDVAEQPGFNWGQGPVRKLSPDAATIKAQIAKDEAEENARQKKLAEEAKKKKSKAKKKKSKKKQGRKGLSIKRRGK
jgi:hypothetical protein